MHDCCNFVLESRWKIRGIYWTLRQKFLAMPLICRLLTYVEYVMNTGDLEVRSHESPQVLTGFGLDGFDYIIDMITENFYDCRCTYCFKRRLDSFLLPSLRLKQLTLFHWLSCAWNKVAAWIDNIKTWTGLSVEESIGITEDRDKLRKYVHGVANPWIEDG